MARNYLVRGLCENTGIPVPDLSSSIGADKVTLAEQLITEVATAFAQKQKNEKTDIYFAQITEYIQKNFKNDITVEDVCRHVELSSTYVNKILRYYKSKSLVQYLNEQRIDKACEMLITTDMKIMEIGEAVGFASTKYFIKTFRILKEVTPGEYRKLNEHTNTKY